MERVRRGGVKGPLRDIKISISNDSKRDINCRKADAKINVQNKYEKM